MNLILNSPLSTLILCNQTFFSSNTRDSAQCNIINNICKYRTILKSKIIRPSYLKVTCMGNINGYSSVHLTSFYWLKETTLVTYCVLSFFAVCMCGYNDFQKTSLKQEDKTACFALVNLFPDNHYNHGCGGTVKTKSIGSALCSWN